VKIKRGSTSVRRLIFIADTSKTDGSGLPNLVYNSSGLVAYYFAGDLNNEVQITLATATLGTWTSGGFVAVDNTNMPGWYEIGIPDAALDGGNEVAIQLRGATNMAPVNIYIELDAVDYQTARFGAPTAGETADAVWDEAYNQHTTAGTFGKLMDTLRKANTVLEGTILASPAPTTTVFRLSGIDYPTGALVGSVLWLNSGASQEQNSPILSTLNNGDGSVTVTLESALVTAPMAGDTVLIDPTSHVHSVAEIQNGLATDTELAKVPKSGETRRYTQVASSTGNKTADVSIGAPL
jgi:hypothetical protein